MRVSFVLVVPLRPNVHVDVLHVVVRPAISHFTLSPTTLDDGTFVPGIRFAPESFLRDNNWLYLYHHNTTAAGNSGRGRLALSAAKERERLEASCSAAGTPSAKGTKSRVQDLKELSHAVR